MASNNDSALSKYDRYSEAGNLAEALGRTGAASKARKRADRIMRNNEGTDFSGVDVQDFSNWESLAPGSADAATKTLTGMRKQGLARRGVDDPGRATNRYQVNLAKSMEGLMKQGLQEEIDPSLEEAQMRADEMMGTAAVSAQDEQAMRSKIAAQVRSAADSRLSRIGNALGVGNVENSPAAAALAARAAEDADRTLVSSLRDLGLQVSQINRQQAGKDIELATRIAGARFGILNGDSSSLISMRGDIASMLDSLYQRDEAIDVARRAASEAGESSTMEQIGGWANIASGLVNAGANAFTAFGGGGAAKPPAGREALSLDYDKYA